MPSQQETVSKYNKPIVYTGFVYGATHLQKSYCQGRHVPTIFVVGISVVE